MTFRITFSRYEYGDRVHIDVPSDSIMTLMKDLSEHSIPIVDLEINGHDSRIIKIEEHERIVEMSIDDDSFDESFEED